MPVETKSEWVERVLGFRLPTAAQAPPDGLTAWRTVRVAALGSLKALESAFRGMKEPETDRAIILLRAIQANLTEAPRTPAQVGELETYITTDRIITEAEAPNGFGIKIDLRRPLLAALAGLRQEQAAVAGPGR